MKKRIESFEDLEVYQKTKHHLKMAFRKGYIEQSKITDFINRYDECGRMLKVLENSLNSWKSKT